MAAHTKIIDLFGLPACGKTTLTNCFAEIQKTGIKVITMNSLIEEARRNKLKLLFSFSLKLFLASAKVHNAIPKKSCNGTTLSRLYLMKHSLFYTYGKRFSKYDYIFVDHGDIQSFVSMERGVHLHKNENFCNACSHYIDASPATLYVYCNITPELSLVRMVNRNIQQGRIEKMEDNAMRLNELEREKERFDFFASLLSDKNCHIIELDMSRNKDELAYELGQIIGLLDN